MVMRNIAPSGAPMGGRETPAGAPPAAQGAQENSPEQVRAALLSVLQRAKALADRYGINLNELVAELGSGGGAPPPPAGAPPMGMGQP